MLSDSTQDMQWVCTECGVENDLDPDAEEDQIIICVECGAEFKVTAFDPLDLEFVEGAILDDPDADGEDDAWDED